MFIETSSSTKLSPVGAKCLSPKNCPNSGHIHNERVLCVYLDVLRRIWKGCGKYGCCHSMLVRFDFASPNPIVLFFDDEIDCVFYL